MSGHPRRVAHPGGRHRPILQIIRMTGLGDAFAVHFCVPEAITADQHRQAAVIGEGVSTGEWCRAHRLL
jgi:hypothetical protein